MERPDIPQKPKVEDFVSGNKLMSMDAKHNPKVATYIQMEAAEHAAFERHMAMYETEEEAFKALEIESNTPGIGIDEKARCYRWLLKIYNQI